MKTSIYRLVRVEKNGEAEEKSMFYLSAESLNEALAKEIEYFENIGYTTEDYQHHKWEERRMVDGWKTVTHVKTLTRVDIWGVSKFHIGYTTYEAQ